jgi:DNA modification methylase
MMINDDFRNHLDKLTQDAFIISDPPYNQGYHYLEYKDSLGLEDYGEMLRLAFGDHKAVVIHYPEETMNVVAKVLENCQQSVAWVYNSNTAKQHRLVTWWNCKPDMSRIGQAYKNPTDKRVKRLIEKGREAKLYDWWEINQVKNVSKKNNPHPCPIPYELARRIILLTTNIGDSVIDPFAGGGTVLKAAKDAGRIPLGFEINKTYCDYANKILSEQVVAITPSPAIIN